MKYAAIGWGVVIYAVVSLAWQGLVIWGLTGGISARLVELLVLLVVALIAGRSLKYRTWIDILPYSVTWAITAVLLDMIYSVPFGGWQIYADWNVWFGYCLVAIVPLFASLGYAGMAP